MKTITAFIAKDVIDGEMSLFAFEHKTGSHWHTYSHYTVIPTSACTGYSLNEKLSNLIDAVEKNGGCEFKENDKVSRMLDMIDPVFIGSFELDSDVTIKVRKAGELLPGMRVLTCYSGRKVWRTVSKILQRSATCYSVLFEDGWNAVAGSNVRYLAK